MTARTGIEPDTSTKDRLEIPRSLKVAGYAAAAWCIVFAGVSALQLATGGALEGQFAAYASGLTAMVALVLILKLAGAVFALASIWPGQGWISPRHLATALWGAFGLLALYSAGNIFITVTTVTGLIGPSAAWTAAGGVTPKAILYVLFCFAGAASFGTVAVSYGRRHRTRWTAAWIGLLGAPLLLGLILAVAPAILRALGLMPG
jgi:hypothetical protein